jgi:hypothetical protein
MVLKLRGEKMSTIEGMMWGYIIGGIFGLVIFILYQWSFNFKSCSRCKNIFYNPGPFEWLCKKCRGYKPEYYSEDGHIRTKWIF